MKRALLLASVIAALLVAGAIAIVPRLLVDNGGAPAIGGPFTLVDHTGRTVTEADYRGRLMLIFFGYTFCPDVCPTTLGTVAQAREALTPEERPQLVPIFVTIDPARDTPPRMAEYVANFFPALVGLTGSPEQVAAIARAYRVYVRKGEGSATDYSMDHSAILYLMDREGRFAGHFDPNATAPQIVAAIRRQLAGKP